MTRTLNFTTELRILMERRVALTADLRALRVNLARPARTQLMRDCRSRWADDHANALTDLSDINAAIANALHEQLFPTREAIAA